MKALTSNVFIVFTLLLIAVAPVNAETIKLRVHNMTSPQAVFVKEMLVPWSEMVEERTAKIGKPVEIKLFIGSSVVPFGMHYKAVLSGTMDMSSNIFLDLVKDRGGIANVMHLPFLFKNAKATALTALDLNEKYPEFRDVFSQAKLMWFHPGPPSDVIFTNKIIETESDLKGLKVYASDEMMKQLFSGFKCIPVDLPFTELYSSLERGIVDFAAFNWEAGMAFKYFEITSKRTILPIGFQPSFMVASMNWHTWKRLPPDVQDILEKLNGRYMSVYTADRVDATVQKLGGVIREMDKKMGKSSYYIPDEEFKKWQESVAPVYENWIKEMEARGLPGRAIFEDAKRLGEMYSM